MKNKILFCLHIPPPVHGSSMVGKYINESVVINNTFLTKYVNLGTSDNVDEIGKGDIRKLLKYIRIIFKIWYQLLVFRPEVCYLAMTAKGGAFYKDVVIGFLLKLFGAQLVIHFHNKGVSVNQHKKLDNFLYQKIFKNAKVVLLSQHLYQDISKYVIKEDVFYCPNGIPDLKLPLIDRRKQNNTSVSLLYLSNLIESKGVFILLKALAILKEKEIPFTCNFIGGEGDINKNQFNAKLRSLNLQEHVQYLGKKYGEDKHEYFSKADVFVFPTFYHNETFGLVNLEAMQYSLPVISTFEGGIPDVVVDGKTGFLIEQQNITQLAEKIIELSSNPEMCYQMGRDGRVRFQEKFTLERFESNFTSILKIIAAN
ncbi:glycosyltransferase family 4 protein [Wenyingzhuangia sp. 2_MG-2023]|uniref:glycosyltransferase family 4 protein n=1 Tax=Wenyingzhuangia sp. 2_MG-2023 TaxID=3062639 RepID=UPI0026E27998|nr:glycosyltransferase family 4 protein [Wenyingzhuangia sp. 2_MG-2023]MDO6739087.1 glycosyltransferase family 4 protein [Wenyingzhuangia sp. 2_MG-2023]